MNRLFSLSLFRGGLRSVPVLRHTQRTQRTHRQFSHAAAPTATEHLPHIVPDLLPYILAVVLGSVGGASGSSNDDDDSGSDSILNSDKSPLELYDTADAGVAVRARRDIRRGELLIAELPLLVWEEGMSAVELRRWTDALTDSARATLFSLSRRSDDTAIAAEMHDNTDESAPIRSANGFQLQLPDVALQVSSREGSGIVSDGDRNRNNKNNPNPTPTPPTHASFLFPHISRINHSCLPTCAQAMDWSTLRMEVYAMRDIPRGGEVTIEYLPGLVAMSSEPRKRKLKDTFGFECKCGLCSASLHTLHQSDSRRAELADASLSLADPHTQLDRQGMIGQLERIHSLLTLEGYTLVPEFTHNHVSRAYAVFRHLRSTHIADDSQSQSQSKV
ncbi:hypothetical protein E3P91_03707 [Wallemia ichthyophaga]|nr:hypothetical protein E3P91_03707 [Wallemia ichthyophaga]TIB59055.1 hypothetical protein E3P78_03687 [Wallemia ichthyophaga]